VPQMQTAPSNPPSDLIAKYTMSITVKITGIAAHRIRKYEEFGLCKPERTSSQQRLFSDYDIEVLRKIMTYEKDGVNLRGIKIILKMENPSEIKQ
jgi:MerR family transcriptional regulator, glutamine synthetase repressor